jgi:hypothetical protein
MPPLNLDGFCQNVLKWKKDHKSQAHHPNESVESHHLSSFLIVGLIEIDWRRLVV